MNLEKRTLDEFPAPNSLPSIGASSSPYLFYCETDMAAVKAWILKYRSKNTQRGYLRVIGSYVQYIRKGISESSREEILEFLSLAALKSPASHQQTAAALSSFFRFAWRMEYYSSDFSKYIEVPRVSRDLSGRILTQKEVELMITLEPSLKGRLLLSLYYETGARLEELRELTWPMISHRPGVGAQVTLRGKGERLRNVLITKELYDALTSYRKEQGENPGAWVFLGYDSKNLSRSRIVKIVKDAAERAGIHKSVSTHWLRHSHASHALDNGCPLTVIRDTLGHRSIATTQAYLHARPGEASGLYLKRKS